MTTTDHQTWLEWRRQGTGASDIAKAATGLYGGRVGVVADKLRISTDNIDPALADRGHRWEQPIADAVHATHELYVHGEQLWFTHPTHPTHLATIDGLLHPQPADITIEDIDDLLETKTRGTNAPWHWDYWTTQTQWQMHVTGTQRTLLAIATTDDTYDRLTRLDFATIDRDDHIIAQLVTLADELWEHVQTGTLPKPSDGSTLEIIRAANATAAPGADVDQAAIDDIRDEIADYADLKQRAKAAGDRLRLAESQIRTAMGAATEATTSDGRWRVRVGKPVHKFTSDSEAEALKLHPGYGMTVLDRARFKAEHPDDYEALKRPTSDRRLTLKEMNS